MNGSLFTGIHGAGGGGVGGLYRLAALFQSLLCLILFPQRLAVKMAIFLFIFWGRQYRCLRLGVPYLPVQKQE